MNLHSDLWSCKVRDDGKVIITHKVWNEVRVVPRSALPSTTIMAALSKARFDDVCDHAFHERK